MTVVATYQSQEMGVKATIKTADQILAKSRKYGYIVSIEDTDADEVVGIKVFNAFDAADEFAKKCVA